ncbi:MAG: response regulator [Erysipelotrichaceae bacterium]|nr:response regulator [Erysipelotrichaceae bacterium]
MTEGKLELSEQTISVIREIGQYMPGGFFIYEAKQPERLLYVNEAVFDIFGCQDLEEFKQLTGLTFRGLLYPDDYDSIRESINSQVKNNEDHTDFVEYRIRRKDGKIRWIEDYGHYVETEEFGGVFIVFITDITEKRAAKENDLAVRQAVIEALSKAYHTVWLINDIETETFSLYRGDTSGETTHYTPIKAALGELKYSQAKAYYIKTTVAVEDQKRLNTELELSNIVKKINEKTSYTVNYLRMMEDGSKRYFRIEFAKTDMPNGKIGVVCGFKDVDDDVREGQAVQKALREAKLAEKENQRLIEQIQSAGKLANLMGSVASLMSNMPAMSFSKDAETGVYLACNQPFAEYAHKASPEEVVGLTDFDIFDPVTAAHFVEDDKKAIEMDEPYIFFEDVPDAAGNIRNLQTTKLKFTDVTGKLCTLGMCVDVTLISKAKTAEAEAKIKQQELEEKIALQEQLIAQEESHEQQNKMITALASDYWSVYYIDLDRNEGICYQPHTDIIDGKAAGEHFPYLETFTHYADKYITKQYHDEFLEFIKPESIKEKLLVQRVISYRFLVKRHEKETYEMVRFAGVRHPEDRDDNKVHAVSACFTDVDEETRKTMADSIALTDALAAARQASKAKTAFLSNMSHEIRTPMNAIIGLNDIAMNDPETSEKTKEYLEKIGSSANHLLNIINDILDMSRIESGRMTIKNEEFSFGKALEQINTMIAGQCRDKGLKYDCNIKGHMADYYIGDEMKLRQVMINILGNAVKFTPEGGSVTFDIENIASFDNMATLRFTIKDTGIGMSKEYLPHLFDSFSQEDSSSTNRFGSTGLGMPITKNIVELMNGTIEVESEKGVGSVFTVTITLAESNRVDDGEAEDDIQPHEMNVLVIDDDEVACEHARIILGQVGIECDTASSGKKGLEKIRLHQARNEAYDLILVDWKMPEMDGVETTKAIREEIGNESAIIILTSFNWDDIEEEAREAGVDSFVSKPLSASVVVDEFREAYKKKNEEVKKADLNGRHILLAEDLAINAEIMIMILKRRNMIVDLANNGEEAVEKFKTSEHGYYDAILMDMRMPKMDGLEATRLIREMDRSDAKSIPIVALTANAFDEDVKRSMQAGLNAHLSKPVEPEHLYETLEQLIRD